MSDKKDDDEKKSGEQKPVRRKRIEEKKDEQQREEKNKAPLLILQGNKKQQEEKTKSNKENDERQPAYKVDVEDYLVKEFLDEDKGKLTIRDAARAIVQADGYITRAARILKINYATLKKLVEKTPKLKQLLDDVIESTNDLAESKLKQQIAAGNLSAIIFHLKCKARHRGWIDDTNKAENFKEQKPLVFDYTLVKNRKDVKELQDKQEKLAKETVSA